LFKFAAAVVVDAAAAAAGRAATLKRTCIMLLGLSAAAVVLVCRPCFRSAGALPLLSLSGSGISAGVVAVLRNAGWTAAVFFSDHTITQSLTSEICQLQATYVGKPQL
jgi:hypothetical protein